ncbi:restriction endonuclease [Actinomadura sp. HBU206391]|uniref:restriction endonuclease n=1 Tax=Actinomadura sp. HBU206391 TaxID=2731692 RepID=UPI00164FA0BD|nr:restriction endonuclease [Actinomadura sp. HBU206391]MBC6457350.1 restriction endonuclease [Actinomadura sp. HBU206391]
MATPEPTGPRPTPRGTPPLMVAGLAATALAGGVAAGWLIVTVTRAVAGFVAAHQWQVVTVAVVVLVLAVVGAVAVVTERQRARALQTRLRRLGHLDRVDEMSGPMFEEFVADLLRRDGYRAVSRIGRSGDRGADVVARTPDGRKIAVQCKRQMRTVGADRVRNLVGAVHGAYTGHVGVLVTSSTFTRPALAEAENRLVLVDRDRLAGWMDGEPLRL